MLNISLSVKMLNYSIRFKYFMCSILPKTTQLQKSLIIMKLVCWFSVLLWPCSSSMCQFMWSFYMHQPKVTLRIHPMLSGTILSATTTTRFLPPTNRKWAQVFPHRFLLKSGRESMLLTTCRKQTLWFMLKTVLWLSLNYLHICYGSEMMQSC